MIIFKRYQYDSKSLKFRFIMTEECILAQMLETSKLI